MSGSYGLGGAGLVGAGLQQKNEAMGLLGRAAEQESARDIENQRMEDARKAGNAQLGSTVGSLGGMAFGMSSAAMGAKFGAAAGPIGAMIGGIVGALGSRLF
jgi:hypothetical protein